MPLPLRKHTFKRPRVRNFKSKDIKIREINNDIEFSEFFEQLLEKTEKFIANKCSHKYGKRKINETSAESKPGSSQLRNSEAESTSNKTTQNLSPITEISDSSSDLDPKTNQKISNSCESIVPTIEILDISSDSGSETEIEEPSFAQNKIFLPKITNICSLGKNKVKLIKEF